MPSLWLLFQDEQLISSSKKTRQFKIVFKKKMGRSKSNLKILHIWGENEPATACVTSYWEVKRSETIIFFENVKVNPQICYCFQNVKSTWTVLFKKLLHFFKAPSPWFWHILLLDMTLKWWPFTFLRGLERKIKMYFSSFSEAAYDRNFPLVAYFLYCFYIIFSWQRTHGSDTFHCWTWL